MTRFEKDLAAAKKDAFTAVEILRERQAELEKVWKAGKAEKNGFRRQCLAQEYTRLKAQYEEIDKWA